MVKAVAASSMLLDHIGIVLFPYVLWLRIAGRLAMPMFAYSMARAFSRGLDDGRVKGYFLRLLVFAAVSQIPYSLMVSDGLNIGFTWLIGAAILYIWVSYKSLASMAVICSLMFASVFVPVDYGLYGVLYPLMFYICAFQLKSNYALIGSAVLWAVYLLDAGRMDIQVIALAAVLLLEVLKRHDDAVRVNKWFYYAFYPAHIGVLVAVKHLI
jgi:hypothetical protein